MDEISRKNVKTRKPHKCWACQRIFSKNTEMECAVYKDDIIYSLYTCFTCISIIMIMRDNYNYDTQEINEGDVLNMINGENETCTPEEFLKKLKLEIEEVKSNE